MIGVVLLPLLACAPKPPIPPSPPSSLEASVRYLADPALGGRDEGSDGSALARTFLIEQMKACGVEPAGAEGFTQRIEAGTGTNVLGRIPGVGGAGAVVLSAHYDHQSGSWRTHPGAYDNATAVAAALQIACSLARAPAAHDVVIAFWDAEEPPTFMTPAMGSAWWVAHPTVTDVRIALVLDLMGAGLWDGYAGSFAFGLESSSELRALEPSVAAPEGLRGHYASISLVEDLVTGQTVAWSDYDAFRDRQTPYLFFTDGQNKRYHTPDDTADSVDYEKLARETAWVEAWTRAIANAPTLPTWGFAEDPDRDQAAIERVLNDAVDAAPFDADANAAIRMGLEEPNTRRAAQRLMCYAGADTPSFLCGML